MIKLSDRHMVVVIPMLHAISSNMHTAIVSKDHMPRIFIVDPESMVIDVNSVASPVSRKRRSSIT